MEVDNEGQNYISDEIMVVLLTKITEKLTNVYVFVKVMLVFSLFQTEQGLLEHANLAQRNVLTD